MAHFAKIENGIVTEVIVVSDEHEADGEAYLNSIGLEGTWIQTSYNNNIRGKFAGKGYAYDAELDEFIEPPVTEPPLEYDENGLPILITTTIEDPLQLPPTAGGGAQ